MPEILGVTNPVPGYEAANRPTPIGPNDTQIQNITDPTRVGRPDQRTEQQDANNNALSRFDSNFQTFVQRLRQADSGFETLSRVVLMQMGTLVSSGVTEGLAEEMAKYLQMIQLDESQLLQLLTQQMGSGARFQGALFNLLRSCYNSAQSPGAQQDILQFLKKWNDFISTPHIEGNLLRNLQFIEGSIPARYAEELGQMLAQLKNGIGAGDRAGNLKLLQSGILPFLGEYISQTHDLGPVRDLISLLALDVTRYENGGQDGMLQAFRQLYGHAGLRERLGEIDDITLLKLLRSTDYAQAAQRDVLSQQFANLAARALRGEGGNELSQAFSQIMQSLLINESVYMPLNHLMIPLEYDGRRMCSEMWVDPDADNSAGTPQGGQRKVRMLLKFDVEEVGTFDLVLAYKGGTVEIDLRCPKRLGPFCGLIQEGIGGIVARNGLNVQSLRVSQMERPLTITEVFPKIYERKNCINVTI